jgi:hypothetical protein
MTIPKITFFEWADLVTGRTGHISFATDKDAVRCQTAIVSVQNGRFIISIANHKPHSLDVAHTDVDRLNAHVRGYIETIAEGRQSILI